MTQSSMPSFVKGGEQGGVLLNKGTFLKLESGKPLEIVPLTGVNPPPGELMSGHNCLMSFQQYTLWLDDLPTGKFSPSFPNLGGKGEVGQVLGLTPTFRCMMLVMVNGEEDEQIWAFGKQVFSQLVEIEQAAGESIRGLVLRVSKTGEKMQTKYRVVPTSRRVPVSGEPETDLTKFVGPTTREEIIKLLVEVDAWPPPGGDPLATPSGKALRGGSENKGPAAPPTPTKPVRPPRVEPVQDPLPVTPIDDGPPWDDEFESGDSP